MNSTQQSMRRSRASRAKVMVDSEGGEEAVVERISVIIFWTVATMKKEEWVLVKYPEERKNGSCDWRGQKRNAGVAEICSPFGKERSSLPMYLSAMTSV